MSDYKKWWTRMFTKTIFLAFIIFPFSKTIPVACPSSTTTSLTDVLNATSTCCFNSLDISVIIRNWLTDYLSNDEVEDIINYVDNLYLKHGATKDITDPTTDKVKDIEHRGYAVGLKMLRAKVRHLGKFWIMKSMPICQHSPTMIFNNHMSWGIWTECSNVEDGHATGIVLENGKIINAKKIVLAPGRDGSAWLTKVLKQHGLELYNNQVDIGVRVETSSLGWLNGSLKVCDTSNAKLVFLLPNFGSWKACPFANIVPLWFS